MAFPRWKIEFRDLSIADLEAMRREARVYEACIAQELEQRYWSESPLDLLLRGLEFCAPPKRALPRASRQVQGSCLVEFLEHGVSFSLSIGKRTGSMTLTALVGGLTGIQQGTVLPKEPSEADVGEAAVFLLRDIHSIALQTPEHADAAAKAKAFLSSMWGLRPEEPR